MASKQLYQAVADILNEEYLVANVTYRLADLFAEDNPRFDRERFLIASGAPVPKEGE